MSLTTWRKHKIIKIVIGILVCIRPPVSCPSEACLAASAVNISVVQSTALVCEGRVCPTKANSMGRKVSNGENHSFTGELEG